MTNFDLTRSERVCILQKLIERVDAFRDNPKGQRVSPSLDRDHILELVNHDFSKPLNCQDAVDKVVSGLEKYTVHTTHPKYFGLYNPRSNFAGILADFITASYNPQMAAWSHAPFAAEAERHVIESLGRKFGYTTEIDGVFTTAGAEANHTAMLCALNKIFPAFAERGASQLSGQPLVYCSSEAQHSVHKAARACGLGSVAVRSVEVDDALCMRVDILREMLENDRQNGGLPFMIIGTAGTTGAAAIDDLKEIGKLAKEHEIWFHADAAYGGAAILSDRLRPKLDGVQEADSITFDAHKWMSVPMGTGMFITRHPAILSSTFSITTDYMPKEGKELAITDAFTHSLQWSRRFIGLKVYLSLLVYGWEGYREVIDHQTAMGDLLREKLLADQWVLTNRTAFPVVCFTDPAFQNDPNFALTIAQRMVDSGNAWISSYSILGRPSLRACITNYNTSPDHVMELVSELNQLRLTY